MASLNGLKWMGSNPGRVHSASWSAGWGFRTLPLLYDLLVPILTHRCLLTGAKFFLPAKFVTSSARDDEARKPWHFQTVPRPEREGVESQFAASRGAAELRSTVRRARRFHLCISAN